MAAAAQKSLRLNDRFFLWDEEIQERSVLLPGIHVAFAWIALDHWPGEGEFDGTGRGQVDTGDALRGNVIVVGHPFGRYDAGGNGAFEIGIGFEHDVEGDPKGPGIFGTNEAGQLMQFDRRHSTRPHRLKAEHVQGIDIENRMVQDKAVGHAPVDLRW